MACLAILIAWVPLARSRNVRWVRPADLSASALGDLQRLQPIFAQGDVVVLHDATGARATLQSAFGTLYPQAARLATNVSDARIWIEPPPPGVELAGLPRPSPLATVRHFFLRDGQLVDEAGRRIHAGGGGLDQAP